MNYFRLWRDAPFLRNVGPLQRLIEMVSIQMEEEEEEDEEDEEEEEEVEEEEVEEEEVEEEATHGPSPSRTESKPPIPWAGKGKLG